MTRGIRQVREYGEVVQEQLVIEGLATPHVAGFVKSCQMADLWAEDLEAAIEDPYNPIVDGEVRAVWLN